MTPSEEGWSTVRSPSRVIQQPIRAVSPRVRRNTENDELVQPYLVIAIIMFYLVILCSLYFVLRQRKDNQELGEVPTAGELLGRSHEELVLLLIQLRRRHAATHRSIEQCCAQISSIEVLNTLFVFFLPIKNIFFLQ